MLLKSGTRNARAPYFNQQCRIENRKFSKCWIHCPIDGPFKRQEDQSFSIAAQNCGKLNGERFAQIEYRPWAAMLDQPLSGLREKFLEGMSHAACTVNVVTTDGRAGRSGVTVSAMSSVSADTPKPTLLVCVHQLSDAAQRIIDNGIFCVNVLRDDQSYVSDTFAGRFNDVVHDKFDCATWTEMPSGAPRVVDPLVGFDCRLLSSSLVGTHHVLFGEVADIFVARQGSALIYANRAYGAASRIDQVSRIQHGTSSECSTLSIGCFYTFAPYFLPSIIRRMGEGGSPPAIRLVEGDHRRVLESLQAGETELALLYDIDLPNGLDLDPMIELSPFVLLAKGHPLAAKSSLKPEDLANYPMVLLDASPSRDYFSEILRRAGIEPNIAFRSANFEMVRGMVGHGMGFTLLATKPASPMTYDGRALVSRPLIADYEPSGIVAARRQGVTLSEQAGKFLSFCQEFFFNRQ